MSKRSILVSIASLAMIFGATSAFAANSLDVNMDAAIIGVYGLEVLVDGSSNATFVASTEATDETVYRVSFRANPNDISMDDGKSSSMFMGRMAGGSGNVIRLYMRRQGGNYKVRYKWKKDPGSPGPGTGYCGQFTFAPNNTWITAEWVQASNAQGDNGSCALYKGNNLMFSRDNLTNETYDIDTARLGLPQAPHPNTSGSFYLDDFASFRTLAPPPPM